MDRVPVSSSNVDSIAWEDNVLEVAFLSGGVYHYYDVSKDIYDDMLVADSVGSFLHQYVKGTYNYVKVG